MLEVLTVLVFVYFLFSLLAATISELRASFWSRRGKTMEKAIQAMLVHGKSSKAKEGASWVSFQASPLYKQLMTTELGKDRFPSYLAPSQFSRILMSVLQSGGKGSSKQVARRSYCRIFQIGCRNRLAWYSVGTTDFASVGSVGRRRVWSICSPGNKSNCGIRKAWAIGASIDIGTLTTFRFPDPKTNDLSMFTFSNIYSREISIVYALPRIRLSTCYGAQECLQRIGQRGSNGE